MSLVRLIARPMLATVFVVHGAQHVRNPEPITPAAAKFADRARPAIERVAPSAPTDPKSLARINAGVQLGAGLALATGKCPRLAALALVSSLVPTTLAGHAFWEADDPAERQAQRVQAMKNVGLGGGLLLASVDTQGKPGLSWRAQRAARDTKRASKLARRETRRSAREAGGKFRAVPRRVRS